MSSTVSAVTGIDRILHPNYVTSLVDFEKWRRTFEGGRQFIDAYLKQFTGRETDTDFATRKEISYVPAHAKAAIIDIRNAIFQRMHDIVRSGGSDSYKRAVLGLDRGVDLKGSSMNTFLGTSILQELLILGRVGVFVDKPPVPQRSTLADNVGQPYLYFYQAEQIRSWHYNAAGELDAVLLEDRFYDIDDMTGLIHEERARFRLLKINDEGKVEVRFWQPNPRASEHAKEDPKWVELHEEAKVLDLERIPFVLLSISNSLLADVADIQIALANLASSDMNYVLKANFPFYVEQVSPQSFLPHAKGPGGSEGTAEEAGAAKNRNINVGVQHGRAYGKGLDAPQFIHPSAEPLLASMQKQEALKDDIRQIINLSLSNVRPTRASAESKQVDNQGLEAGLSYVGLELEYCEREIAKIWADYEGGPPSTVKYPVNYELRSDADRRQEAKELGELKAATPSLTFKKEICKQIAHVTLGTRTPLEVLEKIAKEIDASKVVETDSETVRNDHEAGFVSTKTASLTRGYAEGEAEQAKKDHAERLKLIAESQGQAAGPGGQARGVSDLGANGNAGSEEKSQSRNTDKEPTTTTKVRGEGK